MVIINLILLKRDMSMRLWIRALFEYASAYPGLSNIQFKMENLSIGTLFFFIDVFRFGELF